MTRTTIIAAAALLAGAGVFAASAANARLTANGVSPNGTDVSASAANELGVNELIVRDVVLPDENAASR